MNWRSTLQAGIAVGMLIALAPQESLKRSVERYLGGDDSQVEALRRVGPAAMRFLIPFRTHARVRRLMQEIREGAASPADRQNAVQLRKVHPKIEAGGASFSYALIHTLGTEVRWGLDLSEVERVAQLRVKTGQEGSGWDALEDLCGQANLDFAFQGGVVRIATPDRLWPPAPPGGVLSEEDADQVRELLLRLGSDSPAERDLAERELRSYGKSILSQLQSTAAASDLETSCRCRRLIGELRAPPAPPSLPIRIWISSRKAVSYQDDSEHQLCRLSKPTVRLLPQAPPRTRFDGMTLAGDEGTVRGLRLKGIESILLKGNVSLQSPSGFGLQVDEAFVDLANQTLSWKCASLPGTLKK